MAAGPNSASRLGSRTGSRVKVVPKLPRMVYG